MTPIGTDTAPASPATGTAWRGSFFAATAICVLALLAVLVVKARAAFDEYPESIADDVVYMEPAWQAVTTGSFANPGIASQLAQKGVPGLDHSSYLNLPGTLWIKTPMLWILGPGLRGLRLVDFLITLGTIAAFAFAARSLVTSWRWLLAIAVFVLNPLVIWPVAGRPDSLSALFGLLALGLLFGSRRDEAPAPSNVKVAAIGALLGCCAACHLFGGIYWGATVLALLVAADFNPRSFLRRLPILAAAWAVPASVNVAWLLRGGPDAIHQFFWMINLKRSLLHSFPAALVNTLIQTVARNPLILPILVALPWLPVRLPRRLLIAWILILAALAAWKSATFEAYSRSYEIHLWASLCCLFAIALEGLRSSANRLATWLTRTTSGPAFLASALILTGALTGYNRWIDAIGFNRANQHERMKQLASATVTPGARVLSTCDAYFLVKRRGVVAMVWHENLDLASFDFVVTRGPPVTKPSRDQWSDVLTPQQDQVLQQRFRLVAQVPAVTLDLRHYPGSYRPGVPGLNIYRRTD
jgi:hypothetical protein